MEQMEIYIHIPFCLAKCGYCDFLSFPASGETQKKYMEALAQEISGFPEAKRREVTSVFFGGGTPTALPAEALAEILSLLRQHFSIAADAEITVECNPKTADLAKLAALRQAGVNRLSIGVQSFDDTMLKTLGRIHTKQDAFAVIADAKAAGFSNISADLMFALPGQSMAVWKDSLHTAAQLGLTHISAYSLIIEENTPFYTQYHKAMQAKERGEDQALLPSEDEETDMYLYAVSYLASCGYHRYEISNFAKDGFYCRHNDGYWLRTSYAGFGLGAASLVGECRYENPEDLQRYFKEAPRLWPDRFLRGDAPMSAEEAMAETVILGLRRQEGVSISGFREKFGLDLWERYGNIIEKHVNNGYLQKKGDRLFFTDAGFLISNICLADFI